MDSLEFMRWAAIRYDDDRFVLVVLFTLMGSQKPGGLIEGTREDVAKVLGYSRPHISRVFNVLEAHRALRRLQRGPYQLNRRDGSEEGCASPVRARRSVSRRVWVTGWSNWTLLREIMEDPDAPEAFRAMAAPGAKLEEREGSDGEGKAT